MHSFIDDKTAEEQASAVLFLCIVGNVICLHNKGNLLKMLFVFMSVSGIGDVYDAQK